MPPPKHALVDAAVKPTKRCHRRRRRRRQATVRSFFAAPPAAATASSLLTLPSPPSSSSPSPSPSSAPAPPPPPPVSIPSPPALSSSRSPPASPVFTLVRLLRRVDVPPRHAAHSLLLPTSSACLVDIPPVAPVRAPTHAALRAPLHSSMRLRSAQLAPTAPTVGLPHSHCHTKQSPVTSPATVQSDHDAQPPISRLSRRNKSRLSNQPNSAPSSSLSAAQYPVFNRHKSLPSLSRSCHTHRADKRPHALLSPPQLTKPPAKKKLHPFFAATAAAVSSAKEERAKTPKPPPPSSDAWTHPSATIHVNAVPPNNPWRPKPELFSLHPDREANDAACASQLPLPSRFRHQLESVHYSTSLNTPQARLHFPVVHHTSKNTNLWAEFYKNDSRIDVINGSSIRELVDWLRIWYEAPDASTCDSDADSTGSCFVDEADKKERVAVVTGRTGCGKSTIIATAARLVGLSVLEINASVCRTGKRIREIIGDALNTHRVTHARFKFSSARTAEQREAAKSQARTLIVFEDVDQLQEDEKGFWSAFQKLVAAGDCRRPIVCTATAFSSQMRHIFAEEKRPLDADMERLLINARIEQALNPPPLRYKHIFFSQRTERQSLAVLSRISGSEALDGLVDMKHCLAFLCQNDTRKAINLLQFWGSIGLVVPDLGQDGTSGNMKMSTRLAEAQGRIGLDVVQAMLQDFVAPSIFQAGSHNYVSEIKDKALQEPTKSGCLQNFDGQQAVPMLDAWCESLDTISFANMLRGQATRERLHRSQTLADCDEDVCLHSDLESLVVEADELDVAAIRFSGKYLSFADGVQQLRDVARHAMQGFHSTKHQAPRHTPYARRPIQSDYIPILRTMAVEHEKRHRSDRGMREGERHTRRTRSRSRKEGFSALELDPETISTLKKASIRRQERHTPSIKPFQ
ncbi:unnamed protein product [Agarophyton chilense]